MSNANGIHHVTKDPAGLGSNRAYCGKIVWVYDMPIGLEHAKACIERETYLQPCKRCMKAALKLERSVKSE